METSGTYDFNLNRNQIVIGALRAVGAVSTGQPVSPEHIADATEALNILVKSLTNRGIGLWTIQQLTLFMDTSTQVYSLGPTATAKATCDTVFQSMLASDSVVNAIYPTTVTGLAAGMNVGVQLDSGVIQWSTVHTVVGTTATLTDVLTSTASAGNAVFAFTNLTQKPLEFQEARRRDVDGNDTSLFQVPLDEYVALANKASQGATSQFHYQPLLDSGNLYIWPVAAVGTDRIVASVRIPFQDMTLLSDTADFPPEALKMLKWGLAKEIAPEYDVNPNKIDRIERRAAEAEVDFAMTDTETSFFFVPDMRR